MPFANHAGVRIHYEVEGHGPPLVLHHSLARSLDAWRDFGYVPALKGDFQLILFDARGHGASDKPHEPAAYAKELMVGDVVAVLDDLGIDRAHFWGYSLGASVGFQIGRHALDRFHSLILGGNSPYGARGEAASKFIGQLRAGMQLGAAKGMEAVLALQEKMTGPLPEQMKARLLATDPLVVLAILDAMQVQPNPAELLPSLTVPCLLYCGDADPAYAGASECAQQMPSATFVTLPGLDHAGALARSDMVLPHVKPFLAAAQAGVFNRAASSMDTLYTSRLVIRPFVLDDLEAAHALYDLDLEWSGPGISLDERRERLLFQIALAHWQLTGGLYGDRAIVLKQSGELIGIVGFRPWICSPAERSLYVSAAEEHAFHAPELGVGYALSSRQRGRGYATEAVRALIDYAFGELEVRRVVALTFRGNHASVAVMRRAGMQIGLNPAPQAVYPWAVGIVENN